MTPMIRYSTVYRSSSKMKRCTVLRRETNPDKAKTAVSTGSKGSDKELPPTLKVVEGYMIANATMTRVRPA